MRNQVRYNSPFAASGQITLAPVNKQKSLTLSAGSLSASNQQETQVATQHGEIQHQRISRRT